MPLHSILLCIPLLLPLPMSRTGINLVWVLSIIQISLLAIVARCLCPNQGLSPTPTPFILFLFCSSVLCWVFFVVVYSCFLVLLGSQGRQVNREGSWSSLLLCIRSPLYSASFYAPFGWYCFSDART